MLTIFVLIFKQAYFTPYSCVEITAVYVASSAEPDQLPHSAASVEFGLGLHCLLRPVCRRT